MALNNQQMLICYKNQTKRNELTPICLSFLFSSSSWLYHQGFMENMTIPFSPNRGLQIVILLTVHKEVVHRGDMNRPHVL